MKVFFLVVIIVICLGAAYIMVFRKPNPPLSQDEVRIGSALFKVELATSTLAQARGLSLRERLGENEGMLFIFSSSTIQHFWMKDMNFPIDIIWIGNGKVLGFAENAVPEPGVPIWKLKLYNSPDGTNQVLEVNAGMVARYGIKVGDAVMRGGA